MKIVFVSDSDQPAASGVGDYTLTLCSYLRTQGIEASVQSLGAPDSSLRASLAERVQQNNPDWVSLQFVPYAYANRGLVRSSTLPWRKLRGHLGTHIMFHEPWIGAHVGASLRERAVGLLQREGIKRAMRELQPNLVNSTNPLYCSMLFQSGIPSTRLPLFGNIPIQPETSDPYSELITTFTRDMSRSDWVVAAFFGRIHPSTNLLAAVRRLHSKFRFQAKRLLMVSLGHCPSAVSTFKTLAHHFPHDDAPHFLVQGMMEPAALSSWMRYSDCALSTTPFIVIEKSSSAVSFVEHGVPVIVIDAGAPVRGVSLSNQDLAPDYWLFGDKRLDSYEILPPRREPQPRIGLIGHRFMTTLYGYGSCAT
ncbi:glycosyltransferase [Cyanobium sp. AMD-g]|uniref:hypothetical protein n=1 Tax=Cyanobium sp. AMD-g TaxID=2823699 RepID=UPI0020CF8648|nr:hypothetical protein [Cyanobium sp. AMD-g]MCP9929770.1 glycosyltransferase [Cyanobium sp. AMD-g]